MAARYGPYGATGGGGGVPPYVPPQYQTNQPPPAYQEVNRYPVLPHMPAGAPMPAVGVGQGAAIPAQRPSGAASSVVDATKIAECMQELRIKDHKEVDRLNSLGELYSMIRTMDRLEKNFIADQLNTQEYETACSKLIAQFKASLEHLEMNLPDVHKFNIENELNCKAAMARFQIGVPATVEHGLQSKKPGQAPKDVAECVQHFITAMDSLRLNMVAVDQVQPLISELVTALNKITALPPDFEAKIKMKQWLTTFASMRATDELDENQARQLAFDLESSHNMFYQSL